jgi:acyl CoA:acetate/3-ketoacid CoA transferase alpha subunit
VRHEVELGAISPEHVHTPGVFVDRSVHVAG